jgi:hypothetical protein
MESRKIPNLLRYVAIAGNMLFVLWILYNGMSEGFRGTRIEVISYVGLVVLLLLNVLVISAGQKKT